MDHLPPIKLPTSPFPKVPYLCQKSYDNSSFASYPDRCRIDLSRLKSGTVNQAESLASFLQCWLYFGVLHETIGAFRSIVTSEFVHRENNGKQFLHTRQLETYIDSMVLGIKSKTKDERRKYLLTIEPCLNELQTMTDLLCSMDYCPLPNEVLLSFAVLGVTIDTALRDCSGSKVSRNWGLRYLATGSMKAAGWCPRDIHLLNTICSELTLFYVSFIHRDTHRADHSLCTKNICDANQINHDKYETRHVRPECKCRFVEPDRDQIRGIVLSGGVPIISLNPNSNADGSLNFKISARNLLDLPQDAAYKPSSFRYRAISHVWSDGLGNKRANALPQCQLEALYQNLRNFDWDLNFESATAWVNKTKESSGSSPSKSSKKRTTGLGAIARESLFSLAKAGTMSPHLNRWRPQSLDLWIDTLCIPLAEDAKHTAIRRMDMVYNATSLPVVLDAELMECSAEAEVEEQLARIAVSGWMRRAWTFQEAVLSGQGPYVKFSDKVIDLSSILWHDKSDIERLMAQHPMWNQQSGDMLANNFFNSMINLGIQELRQTEASRKEEARAAKMNFKVSTHIRRDLTKCFPGIQTVKVGMKKVEPGDRAIRIKTVWNALRWRASSEEEDKLRIFAASCCMLAEDFREVMSEVWSCSKNDRMALWLSHQTELPMGLLFVKGQRLTTPGLRWAPSRLSYSNIEGERIASKVKGFFGIRTENIGFVFRATVILNQGPVLFQDDLSGDFFTINADTESGHREMLTSTSFALFGLLLSGVKSQDGKQSAVLIGLTPSQGDTVCGEFITVADVAKIAVERTVLQHQNAITATRQAKAQSWLIS